MSSSARIDELRRKFDENPRRYFAPLANEYRKAGDFDQAIFICQEYLPQQPGHMSGHIVFGQALFEAKRLPEARTVFETALTLDPENLIALRHLADISRDLGEFEPAKAWYERVLQADPRNEEIAAIMASMAPAAPAPAGSSPIAPTEETPARVVPEVAAHAAAPASAAAAPTMELSAAAVQEMVRARQAAQSAKTETAPQLISLDDAATVEINSVATPPVALEGFESTGSEATLDIPASGGMLDFEPTAAQDSSPAPTLETPSPGPSDTLTLDDFSMPSPAATTNAALPSPDSDGLLDLGSFGFSEPAPSTAPPTSDISAADLTIDAGSSGPTDFELEIPDAPLAPPPPAIDSIDTVVMDIPEISIPASPPSAETMPVTVADLTLPVEGDASTPTVIIGAIRLNQAASAPPATLPSEPDAVIPMQQLDVPAAPEHVVPDLPFAEVEATAPGVPAPAPFVTETMAQLYLEQGHRADALDIYRQLVAARPDDMALRARFDAVEQSIPARPARPEAMAAETAQPVEQPLEEAPSPSRFSSDGPTIRDVLRGLFGVDNHTSNGDGSLHGEPGAEVGSIDILFSREAPGDAPSSLAVAFDGGYVAAAGSIDEVFVGGPR